MSFIKSTCCGLQAESFGGLFKHCDPPECCCGCCSALRPRYKRLVDNIFPTNPLDGLVKTNMEKLKFYAASSPEKLDRIGDYLAQRITRDLARHRLSFVVIGMDAMDQILVSCRSQSLNLFVESFLRTVQQLLENQNSEMQLLGTNSFIKFANIEEDTPSYHRRYDFFVSKFSSLCHNNDNDIVVRRKLRDAGLNGIKGVIRKTVSDDLQADIWDENHMEKIVPSLLYNIQDSSSEAPSSLAEKCLRELSGRATFGNIRSVIKPVLKHLDNHCLWDSSHSDQFAIHTFKIIMNSIQSQRSYAVIQILMSHLDDKSRKIDENEVNTRERTGIVMVLSNIVAIAAAESIGPSVLEIINSLLNHLRNSINNCSHDSKAAKDEKIFQDTVINTLGEFANNLPDFQKIEIMVFIISKVPPISSKNLGDILLQDILLKSLLKVSTKYKTVNMAQAFPNAFLKPLLSLSLAADNNVRLTVQQIFHQLLDRQQNLIKLGKPLSLTPVPKLNIKKAYRQDLMFMNKHGNELLMHIYENTKFSNNNIDNLYAIYTTMSLLCIEMSSEETLSEIYRVAFAIQDFANSHSSFPEHLKAAIHSILAGFFHLTANLIAIPALCAHVEEVIKIRKEKCRSMLPELNRYTAGRFSITETDSKKSPEDLSDDIYFNKATVAESLRSSGHDTSRLMTPFLICNVVVDSSMSRSTSDLNSINVEVESNNSSPRTIKKIPGEEFTFDSIRKILSDPQSVEQELREERRLQTMERFRTESFETLVDKMISKTLNLQEQLTDVFSRISTITEKMDYSGDKVYSEKLEISRHPFIGLCNTNINTRRPPLFAVNFPDMFVC